MTLRSELRVSIDKINELLHQVQLMQDDCPEVSEELEPLVDAISDVSDEVKSKYLKLVEDEELFEVGKMRD